MKALFDFINEYQNSKSSDIYIVIGLIYLYIPFIILPIYNILIDMPKNLIYASKDLGRSEWSTFIHIVMPYKRAALASGLTLVFLPILKIVSAPQFLNSSSSGSLIGDIIMEERLLAQTSDISLVRASTLVLIFFMLVVVGLFIYWLGRKYLNLF